MKVRRSVFWVMFVAATFSGVVCLAFFYSYSRTHYLSICFDCAQETRTKVERLYGFPYHTDQSEIRSTSVSDALSSNFDDNHTHDWANFMSNSYSRSIFTQITCRGSSPFIRQLYREPIFIGDLAEMPDGAVLWRTLVELQIQSPLHLWATCVGIFALSGSSKDPGDEQLNLQQWWDRNETVIKGIILNFDCEQPSGVSMEFMEQIGADHH